MTMGSPCFFSLIVRAAPRYAACPARPAGRRSPRCHIGPAPRCRARSPACSSLSLDRLAPGALEHGVELFGHGVARRHVDLELGRGGEAGELGLSLLRRVEAALRALELARDLATLGGHARERLGILAVVHDVARDRVVERGGARVGRIEVAPGGTGERVDLDELALDALLAAHRQITGLAAGLLHETLDRLHAQVVAEAALVGGEVGGLSDLHP